MMQLAGPAQLRMGGPMMMNRSMTLAFSKKGVYRLGTKTVPMPGAMEIKTVGPRQQLATRRHGRLTDEGLER